MQKMSSLEITSNMIVLVQKRNHREEFFDFRLQYLLRCCLRPRHLRGRLHPQCRLRPDENRFLRRPRLLKK